MAASPTRRRSLIVDQIVVPATKVLSYEQARLSVRRILPSSDRSPRSWIDAGSALRERAVKTPDAFDARCLRLSAQALEAFAGKSPLLRLKGVVAVPSRQRPAPLVLSGVYVSVAPEIALIQPGTEEQLGAILFCFSKSTSLRSEGLQYVAALVQHAGVARGAALMSKYCLAVDAFAGLVQQAPRATKTRVRELKHACEEIAERWPALYHEQAEKAAREPAG